MFPDSILYVLAKMTVVHFLYSSVLFYIFSILTIRLARSLEDGYCYNLSRLVCCANYENTSGTCRECEIGYSSNLGESCNPCTDGKYGRKCAFVCYCNIDERCDSIYGLCTAKSDPTTFSGTLLFTDNTVTTWTDHKIVTDYDMVTTDEIVTDKKTTELTGRETILVYLLSVSGVVIIVGIVYACCRIKKTVFLRTRFQTEQLVAQSELRTDNDTDSTHERQISEVNIYESIDESAMIDVLPINLTINMGESSDHSALPNMVEAEIRNLNLQPNRSSVTNLKSDTGDFGSQISKQHVADESSGSESSACEGYLNPYQPVTMNAEKPNHDYSVLTERKYMTILDPKIIMQTENCQKQDRTADQQPNTNQGDADESSGSESSACEGYLNPYQPVKMNVEKAYHDYSVLTERKYMTILDPKMNIHTDNCQKLYSITDQQANTNQGDTDNTSGSESSACEGYLNPYQPLTMEAEKPRHDYSVLTERKYMTMLDPKIYKLQPQHQMPIEDYEKHSGAVSRSNTDQMETDMLSGSDLSSNKECLIPLNNDFLKQHYDKKTNTTVLDNNQSSNMVHFCESLDQSAHILHTFKIKSPHGQHEAEDNLILKEQYISEDEKETSYTDCKSVEKTTTIE